MRFAKLALAGVAAVAVGAIALPVLAQEHATGAEAAKEHAGGEHELLEPEGGWQHEGFFGTFDQNQLQRGYKVYQKVCSSCHGLELLSFRNLGEPGGPFYMPEFPNPNDNPKVKKLAEEHPNLVTAIDPDSGDDVKVPAKPADHIPSPYKNEIDARVRNGGALPPDLSVIAKARHGEASYVYSLLLGFVTPPEGLKVNNGQHYNAYFAGDTTAQWSGDPRHKPAGGFLAMAPPLADHDVKLERACEGAAAPAAPAPAAAAPAPAGESPATPPPAVPAEGAVTPAVTPAPATPAPATPAVPAEGQPAPAPATPAAAPAAASADCGADFDKNSFDDGTETSLKNMARDVATFLAWASDPKAVARKQLGATAIPFMLILAVLVFLSYRRLWRDVEH